MQVHTFHSNTHKNFHSEHMYLARSNRKHEWADNVTCSPLEAISRR